MTASQCDVTLLDFEEMRSAAPRLHSPRLGYLSGNIFSLDNHIVWIHQHVA
jgi:hypothetical protein